MYFLLGVCKGITLFKKNSLLKFIQLVLLLATVTEVVQLWVPERAFNPMDWISNVAGICVGIIVIIFYGKAEGPD
jgi:VanZ family protein